MPLELMTMIGGGLAGFIFRYMAERAKERAEFYRMAIGWKKAVDDSANQAIKRVSQDAGKWVRRTIVMCVLFGVILAPFILSLIGVSSIVQITETGDEWLWGLFGGGETIKFVEIQGYLMMPEVRQTLTAIIGFYFGNATARVRNW